MFWIPVGGWLFFFQRRPSLRVPSVFPTRALNRTNQAVVMAASGMMEGMEKGHVVTKLEGVHKKAPSRRRGHLGKRTKVCRF